MPIRRSTILFLLTSLGIAPLRAVMIDEIQVYTDDINAPGQNGLELHINTTPQGRTSPDFPGEITPQHGLRVTPEFSFGLNADFEAGLYLPMERTAAGAMDFAGPKIRLKWIPVHPDAKLGGWFFGLNGELSHLQPRFEESQWSFEWRTMLGYHAKTWLVAANPIFGWELAGPNKSGRPETELQLKASWDVARGIAFGPEYYADFGRFGRTLPTGEQDRSLYAAFDVDLKPWVFNVGVGRGLTHAADRWTLKFIFEVPW